MSTPTAAAEGEVEAPAAVAEARPDARVLAMRFVGVALLVVLDLWSKAVVFRWLEEEIRANRLALNDLRKEHHPIAGEWLSFMLNLNPGAAFGQLDSVPYLLVCGRIGAALFLIWLVVTSRPGRRVFNTALVLVLAGALGNLYDNLLRARDLDHDGRYVERPFGPVRDFIDVYFGVWDWHFPTFNVADSCITVGAVLLLACGLFGGKKEQATTR